MLDADKIRIVANRGWLLPSNRARNPRRAAVGITVIAALSLSIIAAPPAEAAGGNASIDLTKTVTGTSIKPVFGLTLAVDKSSAIPSDVLTYTATATNTGSTLAMNGVFQATSSGDVPATVADWYDEVEYFSKTTNTWVPVAGMQASSPGYTVVSPSPISSGMTVTPTPKAAAGVTYPTTGDHILGAVMNTHSVGRWNYAATVTVPAALVNVLKDCNKVGDLRNVIHFEVTPRGSGQGQPYIYRTQFANPFLTTAASALTAAAVTLTLPSGVKSQFTPSTTPGLASLAAGASVKMTTTFRVPVPAVKGTGESDSAYLARLAGINATILSALVAGSATSTTGTVTAAAAPAVTTAEQLPVMGITKSGPDAARAGTTPAYTLALVNTGAAAAAPLTVSDTLPGGASGTVTAVPSSLLPGKSGQATATYPIPDLTVPGGLTDVASVAWSDVNGNSYGPVSSSLTTQVTSFFTGATLTLTPATAGPNQLNTRQTLTATFTDSAGHPIAAQDVTFTVSGANVATGSATTTAAGSAVFTYTGTGGGTDTDTATFRQGPLTIMSNAATVTWRNPPPVAQDTTAAAQQNTPQPIPLTASSPVDLPLTYHLVSSPGHGGVTIVGATATYTPTTGYTGPDSFTFAANDGSQDSNTATVTITVIAVNQPPIAGTLSTTTIQRLAGDPVHTYFVTEIGQGAIGKVTVDTAGHATVQTNFITGLAAPDSLIFDHHGHIVASNEGTGDLSLIDPVTGAILTRAINSTKLPVLADLAMDPTSDAVYGIVFRGSGPQDIVKISLTDGAVTGLNPDNIGGFGGIAITPDGSRLFADSFSGGDLWELDPATGHVLRHTGVGGNGDGMTVDPVSGHLFIAKAAGTIEGFDLGTTANPALTDIGAIGSGMFSADGISADGTGGLLVVGGFSFGGCCLWRADPRTNTAAEIANSIPNADDVAPVVGAGAPLSTTLSIPAQTLIDLSSPATTGLHLTVTTVTTTADTHGTAALTNGTITYLPDFGYTGPASFTYRICDDATLNGQPDPQCATGTVNVTVTPRHPPTTSNSSAVTPENGSVALTPASDSPDGRPIQLLVVTPPAHGSVAATSSTAFTYTPTANYNGPDAFTYKATDGYLESGASTATITVTPVNQPPTVQAQTKTAVAGQDLTFPAADLLAGATPGPANETSQTLTLTSVTAGTTTHGTITLVNTQVTYTSDPLFTGQATATFVVCDNGATSGTPDPKCATAILTIAVTAGPPPTAAAGSATTTENSPVTFNLTGTSSYGRVLTYQVASAPTNGSVTINGSTVTYTPITNYNGSDSFTFTVNDGLQSSPSATVTLNVTAVNQPPTAIAQTKTATSGQILTFPATDLLVGATPGPPNESDQTVAVTAVTASVDTHGTVALIAGQVSYTSDATFIGSATASYTICDNGFTNGVTDPKCASGLLAVNVISSQTHTGPLLVEFTASQANYSPGQPVIINAAIRNTSSVSCNVSTAPGSFRVVNVTRNGSPEQPQQSGYEIDPADPAPFQGISLGPAQTITLQISSDNYPASDGIGQGNLEDIDGNGNLTLWDLSEPGIYSLSVVITPNTRYQTVLDPCLDGETVPTAVTVSISGSVNAVAQAGVPDPHPLANELSSNPTPTGMTVTPGMQTFFDSCRARFETQIGDPAGTWKDVQLLAASGKAGSIGTFDDLRTADRSAFDRWNGIALGLTTYGFPFSSLQWKVWINTTFILANYPLDSQQVIICGVLYHELTHAVQSNGGLLFRIFTLNSNCIDAGDGEDTHISVGEVSAKFAQNAFIGQFGIAGNGNYGRYAMPGSGCQGERDITHTWPGDRTVYAP